jgi:type II secretory pathway pseudopilin PulG
MRLHLENDRPPRVCDRQHFAPPSIVRGGFVCTFWELLISVAIVALVFGTIVNGYLIAAKKSQWTGCALAAQLMAVQTLEQTRSAVWDIAVQTTEITNMNLSGKTLTVSGTTWTMTGYTTNILDIPWKSTNYIMATNFITIKSVFANGLTNPWVQLQVVQVDTVWPFDGWGNFTRKVYTNSACTLMAPDNRDPGSLGVDED